MQTSQKADGGLKKKIHHEGEHNGKDDRACDVERRQDTQREQATEKECPRIGRQRHLRLVDGLVRHRSMWLWQMIVGDGRQRGAGAAVRQQSYVSPPGRSHADVPDLIQPALTDLRPVERTKYAGLTYMAIIKSRQQHNEDRVRWQIEADHPRSHHRAVDARAVERTKALQRPLPEECLSTTHPM
jgi:hypothetical protein